jgi:hypothetical protein
MAHLKCISMLFSVLAVSFIVSSCASSKGSSLPGTYTITVSKGTPAPASLSWILREDGTWEMGDEEVPEAIIRGTWQQSGDSVKMFVQTVGGRPAEKEPRTPDTKLIWKFMVDESSGLRLRDEDKMLVLERKQN